MKPLFSDWVCAGKPGPKRWHQLIAACGFVALVGTVHAQNTMSIVSGDNQTVARVEDMPAGGEARFAPLSVVVRDASGKPLPGVRVAFTCAHTTITCQLVPSGQRVPVLTTDAGGMATLRLMGGYGAHAYHGTGSVKVSASTADANAVTFNLTVTDAPPPAVVAGATLIILSGNRQTVSRTHQSGRGSIPTAMFEPLRVALKDGSGKPLQGERVRFSCIREGGPACDLRGGDFNDVRTDANGIATLDRHGGKSVASYYQNGPIAVVANYGNSTVRFDLTVGEDLATTAYNAVRAGSEGWMRPRATDPASIKAFQRDVEALRQYDAKGLILILETPRALDSNLITGARFLRRE